MCMAFIRGITPGRIWGGREPGEAGQRDADVTPRPREQGGRSRVGRGHLRLLWVLRQLAGTWPSVSYSHSLSISQEWSCFSVLAALGLWWEQPQEQASGANCKRQMILEPQLGPGLGQLPAVPLRGRFSRCTLRHVPHMHFLII